MSIKPCPVGEEIARGETEARLKANAAFKGDANSVVGLAHSQAAVDYARAYDLHVRLNNCERCGGAHSQTIRKEMAVAR